MTQRHNKLSFIRITRTLETLSNRSPKVRGHKVSTCFKEFASISQNRPGANRWVKSDH